MYHVLRVCFVLAAALWMSAGVCRSEEVFFSHKTESKIKFDDCTKIQGRHDISPTYICFEKDEELKQFDPGTLWEEADVTEICFQKNDRNKIVLKIVGKETQKERYFYPDSEGNLIFFEPGQEWKLLNESDCKELRKNHTVPEVPKGISGILFHKEKP